MEEFVANAALLAGHLTQQCEKAASDQNAAAVDLQRAAADVGQGVVAGRAELIQGTKSAVRDALSQEIPSAVEAVAQAGDRLRAIIERLERDQASTAARMRLLGWKTFGALAFAAVVIVGGTAYFASTNVQRAQRASVDAQVLEALQQVAITSCDGKPCVKLQDGQARWGKNDDYILIDSQTQGANGAP